MTSSRVWNACMADLLQSMQRISAVCRLCADLDAFTSDTRLNVILKRFIHHLSKILAVLAFAPQPYKQHPHMYAKHIVFVCKFSLKSKHCSWALFSICVSEKLLVLLQ